LGELLIWIGDILMKYSSFYDGSVTAMGSSKRYTLEQVMRNFSFLERFVRKGKEKIQAERLEKRKYQSSDEPDFTV
jgi:hypothetical protein